LSLNNRELALKTNTFSVKQPSQRDDEKIATRSSEQKKGMEPFRRSLKKVIFLVCAEGIKCKTRVCILGKTSVHKMCVGLTVTDKK
jgi:hypothetical protein